MFKYRITKRGRKWFEGVTTDGKNYKASIEINDISADWEVGSIPEFEGRFEKKISGGFTKVYIYPCTTEQKQEERQVIQESKEKAEIEKWLGYVEKNSSEYVYQNGVEKLKKMNLSEDQKIRLEDAIKIGTINSLKKQARDYLGYIKNSISENRWYKNGEKIILENITKLEKMDVDATFYKNSLQELKDYFTAKKEEKQKADNERYFNIQNLSLYGEEYKNGEIVQSKDGRIGKVIKAWKYFETDTMSFGYMVDGGWLINAKCDITAVTELEKEEFLRQQEEQKQAELKRKAEAQKKVEKEKLIDELFFYVRENGIYPEIKNNKQIIVTGEEIYNSFTIYGGGRKIILDSEKIWIIRNNGADGDNWSYNNIATGGAGAIGHYMVMDAYCKKVITRIA